MKFCTLDYPNIGVVVVVNVVVKRFVYATVFIIKKKSVSVKPKANLRLASVSS